MAHDPIAGSLSVDAGGEFFVHVSCWVRVFHSDGTNTGGDACPTFEVLSK
jgi:hypothetical protein